MITLQEYYDLLVKHDWSYQYSDDQRDWGRGRDEHWNLTNIAREYKDAMYDKLYKDYRTWFFSSDDDIVKPVRPE